VRKVLILGVFVLVGCITPRFYEPSELAEYTNCEPSKIAYWITGRMNYLEQGPYWDDASVCMRHQSGDCKCAAAIAMETLNHCPNIASWMVILDHKEKKVAHAVAFFTKGDRIGYIDWGRAVIGPSGVSVSDLIADMPGGVWEERE